MPWEPCKCPRTALCDECLRRGEFHLSGMAGARGWRWAESVARRRPDLLTMPWPPLDGRVRELAHAKVADIADDPRLVELFTIRAYEEAARIWERMRTGDLARPR